MSLPFLFTPKQSRETKWEGRFNRRGRLQGTWEMSWGFPSLSVWKLFIAILAVCVYKFNVLMKSGFTCKCGCSVCAPPPFSPLSLASKSYMNKASPTVSHGFLCYTINRSIYIAFHGWALSQYFRGPPVNWPLIIYCSLVHHILHKAYVLRYNRALAKTQSVFLICFFAIFCQHEREQMTLCPFYFSVCWFMLVTWERSLRPFCPGRRSDDRGKEKSVTCASHSVRRNLQSDPMCVPFNVSARCTNFSLVHPKQDIISGR